MKGHFMSKRQDIKLQKQWKRNRLSLAAIIICSVINIFSFILQVIGLNANIYIPYGLLSTYYSLQIGYSLSEMTGVYMNFLISAIIALLILGVFVFLYLWSFKKNKAYL